MHPPENSLGAESTPESATLASAAPQANSSKVPSRSLPTAVKSGANEVPVQVTCAIPARYASQRLPGKPLRLLAGKPMVQHVVERVSGAAGLTRTVVLTDDERIANTVRAFGGEVEMTPVDCASGTDRIAWAARSWPAPSDANGNPLRHAVINVQGDEPLIDPSLISRLAQHLVEHAEDEMVTVATQLDQDAAGDPSNVKVVTDLEGNALYFSRAHIPHQRDSAGDLADSLPGPRLHVGLYGYRLDVLERLASLAPTPLERTESLEQLRALENGIKIRVLNTEHRAFGVDTEDDLVKAEQLLSLGT